MTPKEKADELFDKYYSYLKANLMDDKEAIDDAKQCALIAVDELIKQVNYLHVGYWEEVKQYIKEI
jgi:hypothetical protein